MAAERFDVIVVGAGPAGSTAALTLAKEGYEVLLVERGFNPGVKNMSGGILYSQIVDRVYPSFWEEAPLERPITRYNTVLLDSESSMNLSLDAPRFSSPPYNAFSVLRVNLDKWMADRAEEAGATLITNITVDELLLDGGRVTGIRSGEDEIQSEVVIDAEGARALLLEQAGLRRQASPVDVSIGVKELVELPNDAINQRFNLYDTEGAVYTLIGGTAGVAGGGFMVTNRSTVSLGLVLKMSSLIDNKRKTFELIEEYRTHPFIRRLTEDGEVIEYSASLVYEGGYERVPDLVSDGILVCGSAATLNLNTFFNLRGMDLAILSGQAAAETAAKAIKRGDATRKTLNEYMEHPTMSHIMDEMKRFRRIPHLFKNPRLFTAYPETTCSVLEELYQVTTDPSRKARTIITDQLMNKIGILNTLRDTLEVIRAI